jgi:hypothetical protein
MHFSTVYKQFYFGLFSTFFSRPLILNHIKLQYCKQYCTFKGSHSLQKPPPLSHLKVMSEERHFLYNHVLVRNFSYSCIRLEKLVRVDAMVWNHTLGRYDWLKFRSGSSLCILTQTMIQNNFFFKSWHWRKFAKLFHKMYLIKTYEYSVLLS